MHHLFDSPERIAPLRDDADRVPGPLPRLPRDEHANLDAYTNFEFERVGNSKAVQEQFGFTMSLVGLKVRRKRLKHEEFGRRWRFDSRR